MYYEYKTVEDFDEVKSILNLLFDRNKNNKSMDHSKPRFF